MLRAYWFWLLLLIISASGVIAHFQADAQTEARIALIVERQKSALRVATEKISAYLRGPAVLLESLRNEAPIREALDNPPDKLSFLEQSLTAVAGRDPSFRQVRWIDQSGMERVRIQRVGEALIAVPSQNLQNKRDSRYVKHSTDLPAGEIYFSPLDLDADQENVAQSLHPKIQVAVPLRNSAGQKRGIFVIDCDATEIVNAADDASRGIKRLLVNEKGILLKGKNHEEEWGSIAGREGRVEKKSPDTWAAMTRSDSGHVRNSLGLWIWSTLDVAKLRWVGLSAYPTRGPKLILVAYAPQSFLRNLQNEALKNVILTSAPVSTAVWLVLLGLFYIRDKTRVSIARLAESERLRKMETTLNAARKHSDSLIENNINGILLVDGDGIIVMTNPSLDGIFGYQTGELIGEPLEILVPSGFSSTHRRLRTGYIAMPINQMMMSGRPIVGRHKNGDIVPVEVSLSPTPTADGMQVCATVVDISERVKTESQLRTFASVFDNSGEAVVITDDEMNILNVNRTFTDITGYKQEEVAGSKPDIFEAKQDNAQTHLIRKTELANSGRWRGEHWGKRKDGTLYPIWMSASTVKNDAGSVTHHILGFSDISSLRTTQQKLERLAYYDALTGLPNRALFADRFAHALARAERHARMLALFFIDLDNFKHVNDAFGHPLGDQLLQQVARILASNIRKEDTVARIGGDEFLVLIEDIHNREACATVANTLLASLDTPFRLGGEEIHMKASMGISLSPEDGADYEVLLKCADAAMYMAKEKGRNRYHFYTEGLTTQSSHRLKLEMSLRQALDRNQLFLVYQPQIDLKTGRLVGIEALVRWRHPTKGVVSPGEFIGFAEEFGMIHALDNWVISTACAQAHDWFRQRIDFGRIAVNLSGSRLQSGRLPDEISSILSTTDCPSHVLELEITEGFFMRHDSSLVEELEELRDIGVSLAIDDFGTGYSSLAYLKKLPIDKLKIDQSFIRDLSLNKTDRQIVSAVTDLGKNLDMTVIAEGVEKEGEVAFLVAAGCDQAQGFYFSKPLTASRFEQEIASSLAPKQPKGGIIIPLSRNRFTTGNNGNRDS